ncbi:MAG TPA: DUF4384 domain-containing protein, partial [Rectinemataceae bacterium]|nr:DUF4384 domain-containing protein [Rectinemataceae bacterium]
MKTAPLAILVALLAILPIGAQTWDAGLPAQLDALAERHWQPSLQTALGTFTYAYSGLATPFSRFLEEGLAASIGRSARLRLFNRAAAAAMDPAFRAVYADLFKTGGVDALLSGRYFDEGDSVRAHLELTGLSDGVLVGTADIGIPKKAIPQGLAVAPSGSSLETASSLGSLLGGSPEGELKVSVATERGQGAVYREGEDMAVLVTVNMEAWIKVYHVDVNGAVQLIDPNRFAPGGKLRAGATVRIPGSGEAFAFRMGPPFGTEFIKV